MVRYYGQDTQEPCLNYRGDEGIPPTAVVDPHIIHGVEVSGLSVPRCRPSLLFS